MNPSPSSVADATASPSPHAIELSVLIVGYRSASFLPACLGGLRGALRGIGAEVLFHDCSQDGSEVLVQRDFPEVRVVPHRGNLGFGGGNNLLASLASGDFLLLLNPDTIPDRVGVRRLLEFARENPACGIWGGRTVHPDGSPDHGSHQSMLTVRGIWMSALGLARWRGGALPLGSGPRRPVSVVSGAFMLVRRELWDAIGGLDLDYFMYAEEVDFCLRASRAGARIMADPNIVMIHDERSGDPYNSNRRIQLLRGNATFLGKHRGPLLGFLGKSGMLVQEFRRAAVHAALSLANATPAHRGKALQSFQTLLAVRIWWSGWPRSESRNLQARTQAP